MDLSNSIWNPKFTKVVIEVDYPEGARPFEDTLEALQRTLREYCGHIESVEIIYSDEIPSEKIGPFRRRVNLYSNGTTTFVLPEDEQRIPLGDGFTLVGHDDQCDISAIIRQYRNVPIDASTYSLYVFCDPYSKSGGGGSANGQTIVLERRSIENLGVLTITSRRVERMTALHELGHLLKLVWNPAHHQAAHCTNPACTMYPGRVNFKVIWVNALPLLLGFDTDFCAECREDLQTYQRGIRKPSAK
ncbi:MAG: hypothetical protein HYY16_00715 [Planctomycetes bacterium]|nr:hypothetical protein [Planctomycetota bacterium]